MTRRRSFWHGSGAAALALVGLICVGGCSLFGSSTSSDTRGAAAQRGAADGITVCISETAMPSEGLAYYRDFAEYVGRKSGLAIHLIQKADYSQVNDMLEQGQLDVAFVCNGPYIEGHDDFGLEPLAAPVIGGDSTYESVLIVSVDSTATRMEDLRGATFAFIDRRSHSGYFLPLLTLKRMGTTPEEFFARHYFTYGHSTSIRAVAEGEADAASLQSLVWDYDSVANPEFASKTKVIHRSEPCAIPPVVVRPDLDEDVKDRLRGVLLRADSDAEGKAILAQMGIDSFTVVDDSAYDSVRAVEAQVRALR